MQEKSSKSFRPLFPAIFRLESQRPHLRSIIGLDGNGVADGAGSKHGGN
jgi:hypothetical protein